MKTLSASQQMIGSIYLRCVMVIILTCTTVILFGTFVLADYIDGCRSSVCSIGDINRDGVPDFMVASRNYFPWPEDITRAKWSTAAGLPELIWLISGRDASIIRVINRSITRENFGMSIDNALDVNKDGFPDQIVGAHYKWFPPPEDIKSRASQGWVQVYDQKYKMMRHVKYNKTTRGTASVFSGKDGALLHQFESGRLDDGFGACVAGGGDVNHDGHADVIVGASQDMSNKNKLPPEVYVFSGKNGKLLYYLTDESATETIDSPVLMDKTRVIRIRNFRGAPVEICPDLNGDAHDEIIVSASDKAIIVSGKTGEVIFKLEGTGRDEGVSPMWLVGPANDLDGDGVEDLFASSIDSWIRFYSGETGEPFFTENWYGGCLASEASTVDAMGDVNGDGFADLVVGANETWESSFDYGFAIVYSGKDGKHIHAIETGNAGIDVCSPGDLDGDGVNDVVGAFFGDIDEIRILSGKDFKVIKKIALIDLILQCPEEKLFPWRNLKHGEGDKKEL